MSLLTGIEELGVSGAIFKYISHIPQLAAMLISDYVFNQQPKLAARLVAKMTVDLNFRILLLNRYVESSDGQISLPPGPARATLVEACKLLLVKQPQFDTVYALTNILSSNCLEDELWTY